MTHRLLSLMAPVLVVGALLSACNSDSNSNSAGPGEPGGPATYMMIGTSVTLSTTTPYQFWTEVVGCPVGVTNCGTTKNAQVLYSVGSSSLKDDFKNGIYVTSMADVSSTLFVGLSKEGNAGGQILSCGTQANPATCTAVDTFGSSVLSLAPFGSTLYAGTSGGSMLSCDVSGSNNCVTLNSFGSGVNALATDGTAYIYAGTNAGSLMQCPAGKANACITLTSVTGPINSVAYLNGYIYVATQPGGLYMYQLATNSTTTLQSLDPSSQIQQLIAVPSNYSGNPAVYGVSYAGWLAMWAPGATNATVLTSAAVGCSNYVGFAYDGSSTFYMLAGIANNVCTYSQATGTLSVAASVGAMPTAISAF